MFFGGAIVANLENEVCQCSAQEKKQSSSSSFPHIALTNMQQSPPR